MPDEPTADLPVVPAAPDVPAVPVTASAPPGDPTEPSGTPIPDRPRRTRGRAERLLRILCVLALCLGALPILLRWAPLNLFVVVVSAVATPFAIVPLIVALALAIGLRSVRLAALGVVGLVLLGVALAPMYVGPRPSASGTTALTVLSINMRFGQADATQIVQRVREDHVDVLATQELTPAAVTALRAAGLETLLPHSVLAARKEAQGTGLWTRFPLAEQAVLPNFTFAQVAANATLDDGRVISLWSVHPVAPVPQMVGTWDGEVRALGALIRSGSQPLTVVSGDFNSSTDDAQFRSLLRGGFSDAARSVNAGWVPTFPADWKIPPVVALDHALYRGPDLRPASFKTVRISGTDHLGIVTRFVS